jgi:hypothetical protein
MSFRAYNWTKRIQRFDCSPEQDLVIADVDEMLLELHHVQEH